MYGDGEYFACMPAKRSIPVTASRSARSSSIWRESGQRLSGRSDTSLLTGSQPFEDAGKLSRTRQEGRVPSGDLDGFDFQDAARGAPSVVAGHHAVAGAQDVSRSRGPPFAQRRDLLGHAPELSAEMGGRISRDQWIAVVIEDLDRPRLRP